MEGRARRAETRRFGSDSDFDRYRCHRPNENRSTCRLCSGQQRQDRAGRAVVGIAGVAGVRSVAGVDRDGLGRGGVVTTRAVDVVE